MLKKLCALAAMVPVTLFFIGCGGATETTAEVIPATLPGNICVVGEEEIGSMGDPVEYSYQGNIIQFCCKHCIPDFKRHTDKYVAALKAGAASVDSTGTAETN